MGGEANGMPEYSDLKDEATDQLDPLPDDTALEINNLMDPIRADKMLCVEFNYMNCHVPAGPGAQPMLPSLKRKGGAEATPATRQILTDITGCCMPGELLALMGPSGSGKTSLLSIVGGRGGKAVQVDGVVLYNGKAMSKRAKRQVGFVLQDDLLYESLTVWETLWYAAQLRLPRSMSKAAKRERVETVLAALGLTRCRNTIIGGFFIRGVSGGERKRVSVGHELLINPSLLLLDEPTSGLDSTTALQLVESLRALASGGRAIITTIHQPSARLYALLDKLLLLAEGRPLYYGKAGLAADWFHRLGYTLPYGTNVADFILDLASGTVAAPKRSGTESLTHLAACSEKFLAGGVRGQGYQDTADLAGLGIATVEDPLASRVSADGAPPLGAALQPTKPSIIGPSLRKTYGVAPIDIEAGAGTVILAGRGESSSAAVAVSADMDSEDELDAELRAVMQRRGIRRTLTHMENLAPAQKQARSPSKLLG